MVEAARGSSVQLSNVDWLQADCLNLESGPATVAAVVGHGILHHLPLEAAVTEISRVLMPAGRIAFYEPNIANPVVFLEKKVPLFRPRTDTPGETGLFEPTVRRMLSRHSFEVIDVTPCEFVLNQVPDGLVPCAERISRFAEGLPFVRRVGGSLRILAVKA